jgi:hypothetical protein
LLVVGVALLRLLLPPGITAFIQRVGATLDGLVFVRRGTVPACRTTDRR